MNCDHIPCLTCEWCPCWVDDPASNTPPGVVIPHHEWHHGLPIPDRQLAELAHAPAPADYDPDDQLYVPAATA